MNLRQISAVVAAIVVSSAFLFVFVAETVSMEVASAFVILFLLVCAIFLIRALARTRSLSKQKFFPAKGQVLQCDFGSTILSQCELDLQLQFS